MTRSTCWMPSFVVLEGSRGAKGAWSSRIDQYGHTRALSGWNGVKCVGTLDADTGVTARMRRGFSV
ncbi:hypothetical protein BD310DRAFT_916609 [Dichomitus squalens]|uniref:Uncharacterized protein n=1 Tax=Dichomitus squalens TaxID=114155 RepID=A0A4Q9Q7X9_9APHY|nr:hypothetical protein BD310DRAFT_916609 [Dichomitus squalens]